MRRLNNNLKYRDIDRILKRNGFVYDRTRGSHIQYVKDGHRIVVNINTNPCVWLRLVKEYKLEV